MRPVTNNLLDPAFYPYGLEFKLTGYTIAGGKDAKFVPLSAMVQGSFTHTQKGQPGGAADYLSSNNNAAMDQASIFYAGRVTSKVGAFVQKTFDGMAKTNLILDNTDIRFADQASCPTSNLFMGYRQIILRRFQTSGILRPRGVYQQRRQRWHLRQLREHSLNHWLGRSGA